MNNLIGFEIYVVKGDNKKLQHFSNAYCLASMDATIMNLHLILTTTGLFVLYALHLIVRTFIKDNKNVVFKVIKI